MAGKIWTDTDLDELRRMFEGGFPRAVIAKRLGRTVEAVKHAAINGGLTRVSGATAYLVEATLPGEEWRPTVVDGYFVSSFGRVISMLPKKTGSILKPWIDLEGYHHVDLRRKRYALHRLVALAFLPRPAIPGIEACHNSKHLWDNSVSNLRWDTHLGNIADKFIHGTILRGEQHPSSKCTETQARIVREALAAGSSATKAAKLAGVSFHTAYDIKRGRTWTWLAK